VVLLYVSNDDKSLENLEIKIDNYPEIAECLRSGEVVFIEDTMNSELLRPVQHKIKKLDIDSIVVVPIRHKNTVIAVLFVRGRTGVKPISPEDIVYCQIIANASSKAISGNVFLRKIMSKFIPKES